MVSEKDLQRTVTDYLTIRMNLGDLVFNRLNSGQVIVKRGGRHYALNLCHSGTPDFIIHKKGESGKHGITFYLELKGAKGKVSQEQELFAISLFNEGIIVYVVKSLEEVIKLVEG